jgi:hypothetical protein
MKLSQLKLSDYIFITCITIVLIVLNEFFLDKSLGGVVFILIYLSYAMGRYIGTQASIKTD